VAGWDWFSIQLSNRTQYMIYVFRNGRGKAIQAIGTRIRRDGSTARIPQKKMKVTRLGTWTSPDTGYKYASGWRLKVPGGRLTITPRLRNQELSSELGKYWEGACGITGTINGKPVRGLGYTELLPPYPHA